jgi:hypothetical protein
MRIHSSTLTHTDLQNAARVAGVSFERLTTHGSRIRHGAYDVLLTGSGTTRGNSGTHGAAYHKAATWDEWGIFLNHLFEEDPEAVVRNIYHGRRDFHECTGGRYRTLKPSEQHLRHRWTWDHGTGECKCGAVTVRSSHTAYSY